MFGFGRLGNYEYFGHLGRALAARFEARGRKLVWYAVEVPPTASIRRRATCLTELIASTCGEDNTDPIHLVGHSTGGLDARLVASPSAHLPLQKSSSLAWLPRLASVTTLSTPHYGTPLASFFSTVSGQKLLYAFSALTVVGLTLGSPPAFALSGLVWSLKQADRLLGIDSKLLDKLSERVLGVLRPVQSEEVSEFLRAIKEDQGAMVQLMPEAMDLFQAGVENREGVFYQCTASLVERPGVKTALKNLRSPLRCASNALFATLYEITSRFDERYPCAAAGVEANLQRSMRQAFGSVPERSANDGVVPFHSQLWGKVAWCGYADHLDVLGHFHDDQGTEHIDWMASGAMFSRARFESLVDAIAEGILNATAPQAVT
jgi:triacylglycerol lipase